MRVLASLAFASAACAALLASPLQAQTIPVGSLVTLVNSGQFNFNQLEKLSAIANQATFNDLSKLCGARQVVASAGCPAAMLDVFSNVRELVQTANELLGTGPTEFSLGSDATGLGFALRWTAAEEMSAPGATSAQFTNTQIASLMSRITALRFGATGFSAAANMPHTSSGTYARGGGASADEDDNFDHTPSIATRWGGFMNGSFSWGKRDPTQLEDAFDFDSKSLTLGVDYRVTPNFVFGGMLGYSKQRIDFDSSRSVVDGGIDSAGYSLTLYGLYEWNGPYISASLGTQHLKHDMKRIINYPSFNINVEAVYATARSSANGNTLNFNFDFGWPFSKKAFTFEPSLRGEYRNVKIDGFQETSVNNAGVDVGKPAGFDFNFAGQNISSLDAALGVKFQYVFTFNAGVLVPYLKADLHHNFDTKAFTVDATYNGSGSNVAAFSLPSDVRASNFKTYTAGTSLVLKHGWQGFVQYQRVVGIAYLSNQIITAGLRGEF